MMRSSLGRWVLFTLLFLTPVPVYSNRSGRRKLPKTEERVVPAPRSCLAKVLTYLAPTALFGVGAWTLLAPAQRGKPEPPKARAAAVRSENEVMAGFSMEYRRSLAQIRETLLAAGPRGITDLELFPPLLADETLLRSWESLHQEYGYRIVGFDFWDPANPQVFHAGMNNPEKRTIYLNLNSERYGTVDPSFILVNEIKDLEFFHRMLDVRQNPPPFSEPFRRSVDGFFEANPDLLPLLPEDLAQRSDFIMQKMAQLWLEKRSYLAQYDWYLRSRTRFPEITRPYIESEVARTEQGRREYLTFRFSEPPYSVPLELGQRLWDYPIAPELSR